MQRFENWSDMCGFESLNNSASVEFYLYPTVSTALIYLLKPELNK